MGKPKAIMLAEYEERYQKFASMRSKYPNIKRSNRSHYFKVIANELHINANSLYVERYEGRWRKEHEAK